MSLQATLIMLDNSAFALNGDYLPTRWETQIDAASLIIQSKLQANMQSSVGLGLMGGKQVQILCTMTSDSVKANSYLFGIKIHGEIHLIKALQIAALALKHRINDTQRQRIVCFIGSTIIDDTETLILIGKKLKKNNIAVDLICFGDCSQQQKAKVQAFTKAVDQEQNSNYIFIEPGPVYLSEKLIGTKIFNSGGGAIPGNIQEEDPEFAAAIRMSLEQNLHNQQANQPETPSVNPVGEKKKEEAPKVEQPSEQQLERLAIELSLQENNQQPKQEQKKEKKQEEKDKNNDNDKKQ